MNRSTFQWQDIRVATAIGLVATFALNILYNAVATPETIDNYLWLSRLQEPGLKVGLLITHILYPVVGYPWSVRFGVVCAYTTLVGIWTLVSLAGIGVIRIAISYFGARTAKHE